MDFADLRLERWDALPARRRRALAASLAPRLPLLRLFEIEKALYELRYELRSRPDWVALPLNDLLASLA